MPTGCPKVVTLPDPAPGSVCTVKCEDFHLCQKWEHCFYLGEYLILSGNLLNHLLPVQIMVGIFEYS